MLTCRITALSIKKTIQLKKPIHTYNKLKLHFCSWLFWLYLFLLNLSCSIHKGPSLYHHLHVQRRKLQTSSKMDIARQIGQAMGYLQAKGIIVGHLSSRCVYLESKVKLSVTRVDTSDVTCQRWVSGERTIFTFRF